MSPFVCSFLSSSSVHSISQSCLRFLSSVRRSVLHHLSILLSSLFFLSSSFSRILRQSPMSLFPVFRLSVCSSSSFYSVVFVVLSFEQFLLHAKVVSYVFVSCLLFVCLFFIIFLLIVSSFLSGNEAPPPFAVVLLVICSICLSCFSILFVMSVCSVVYRS